MKLFVTAFVPITMQATDYYLPIGSLMHEYLPTFGNFSRYVNYLRCRRDGKIVNWKYNL